MRHSGSVARRLTFVVAGAATLVVPLLGAPVLGATQTARTAVSAGSTEANLTATAHDLGTLGGRNSRALAMDGSVVVGASRTSSRDWHAFAYDLAAEQPTMVDLGTLGGRWSEPTDVDGSVVVGTSTTGSFDEFGDAVTRAFAYDLASEKPTMVDLGTLGGDWSIAEAVHDGVVVGRSTTGDVDEHGDPAMHAFAYDLAAETPTMVDLGTLGGDWSSAHAVDQGIVVGTSGTGPSEYHAFAYDLAAEEPKMKDLGDLGGWLSSASAVADGLVVGRAENFEGAEHAFVYDLTATKPAMRDLGALQPGGWSEAEDVDGGMVVGFATSRPNTAFAYDLAAPDPVMRDFITVATLAANKRTMIHSSATDVSGRMAIGNWAVGSQRSVPHGFVHDLADDGSRTLTLGGWRGSRGFGIDGGVVVGEAVYADGTRATAWTLSKTRRPLIAFRHVDRVVKEGVGRVTVRVDRYGRTDRAVTVRFRTRGQSAKAGKDFVSTSGKLRFPAGVTSRRFAVRILDDRRSEYEEELLVTLSHPSRPALLGTPSWSHLRIRPSDS